VVDPQEFLDFYLDSQFEDIAGWKPLPRARMIKQAGRTMNSKRTRGKAFDAMDRLGDNSGTRMRREFGPGLSMEPAGKTIAGEDVYFGYQDIGAEASTLRKNQRNQKQFDREGQILRDSTNLVDGVPVEFTDKEMDNRFRGLAGKARSKPASNTVKDRFDRFRKFVYGYGDAASIRAFKERMDSGLDLEDSAMMSVSSDKHLYLKPEEKEFLKEQVFDHWNQQADQVERMTGRRVASIDRDGHLQLVEPGGGKRIHPGILHNRAQAESFNVLLDAGQKHLADQYQLPSELRRSGPLGDFANEALYEWNTYRNAAAADRAGMAHDLIRTIDTPSHPGMSLGEMMFQTP
jgi:hypothetical protein